MKNWNTPEIIDVDIKDTANGWKWWHKEYVDFFGGLTFGEVDNPGTSDPDGEPEGQGKGEDETTSTTGDDKVNGLS